jgi:hypothetical protein
MRATALRLLDGLPSQEDRLRAALAAHEADGLALDDLGVRVDAGAGAVAEAVAHHLGQVAHELVVVLQSVGVEQARSDRGGDVLLRLCHAIASR